MAQYLIHVHSGPDLVNKATLALLVARTAVAEGHAVELFLAADGTHLLNCKAAGEVVGEGTGDLFEHLTALKEAGTCLHVSGMSAKARGYDESLLDGYNAAFAMPTVLLERSAAADVGLCY